MAHSAFQVTRLAKIKYIIYYFAFQSANLTFKMALLAIFFFGCTPQLWFSLTEFVADVSCFHICLAQSLYVYMTYVPRSRS